MIEKTKFSNQLVVVVGCQRSGTTLTGQVLGAHPSSFLLDEPDGLYTWFEERISNSKSHKKTLNTVIESASAKYKDFRQSFNKVQDVHGYNLILKAPNLTFSFNELLNFDPKPIIIFLIRDVRSVVSSMLQFNIMVPRQTNFFRQCPEVCNKFVEELSILQQAKTPAHIKCAIIWNIKSSLYMNFTNLGFNTKVIRYEDLVLDAENVSMDIAQHCNMSHDESMLKYHKYLQGKGPGKTLRQRKIDKESLLKWKTRLTEPMVNDIMAVSEPLMDKVYFDQI